MVSLEAVKVFVRDCKGVPREIKGVTGAGGWVVLLRESRERRKGVERIDRRRRRRDCIKGRQRNRIIE